MKCDGKESACELVVSGVRSLGNAGPEEGDWEWSGQPLRGVRGTSPGEIFKIYVK